MSEDRIFVTKNLGDALVSRLWPAITTYNRLEGRPRTLTFERALRAEVRDALWMLTRQWQLGEFQGDDAGSPFLAKLLMHRTELTRYRPGEGTTQAFDDRLPLEARVERRPIPLRMAGRAIALDVRLLLARSWLKLIAGLPDYRAAFLEAYPITAPNPDQAIDADRAAHPEVSQVYATVAKRRMDGGALYEYLTGGPDRHAYDGIATIDPSDYAALDHRAREFVAGFRRMLTPPPAPAEDAWDPSRLEYRFSTSAPQAAGEKVYVADAYHGGNLDWWAFDVDKSSPGLLDSAEPPDPVPSQVAPRTLIPAPVVFEGMPNTRWWAFEDRRTNLGDVSAATTDLAKLLFLEFALVYANDWFLIPIDLPAGSIARVRGLAVTNVFGERIWVEPAGVGANNTWQRWSMFAVNVRGALDGVVDDSLLLAPTVPEVQDGEPLEEIMLVRDEMANMVWGIERIVPLPSGDSKRGAEAGRETLAFLRRLPQAIPPPASPTGRVADVRYDVMSSVPEHWIPFIPVHIPGDNREIQLQRASLPRDSTGLPPGFAKVRPRTLLLREGIDAGKSYVIHEEEVTRSGTVVEQSFQRTRWHDGRTVLWLGVRRGTGRGRELERAGIRPPSRRAA